MRISDWSSDVCSSDLIKHNSSGRFILSMRAAAMAVAVMVAAPTWTNAAEPAKSETMPMTSEQMDQTKITKQLGGMSMTGDVDYDFEIGKASCRERVGQEV